MDSASLYEILSLMIELEKQNKKLNTKTGRDVSDSEWQQAESLLASVTKNDPSVKV